MPKGSKVEEVYDALRREGMSKERAAKIAQAQTGLALATGKPTKGTENMADEYFARNTKGGVFRIFKKGSPVALTGELTQEEAQRLLATKYKNSSFSNGRQRAMNAIDEKMKGCGIQNGPGSRSFSVGNYRIVVKDAADGDVEWQAFRGGSLMAEGDATDDAAAVREAKKQLGV